MAVSANSGRIEKGRWVLKHYKKKASVTIVGNTLVQIDSAADNGFVVQATTTAGAAGTPLLGVYAGKTINSSSSNYATNDRIPVLVPLDDQSTLRLAVSVGSLAQDDVGEAFDVTADADVTVSTQTNKPLVCREYISATEGLFSMKPVIA